MRLLLAHGADVNNADTSLKRTALFAAAATDQPKAFALLLQHGANVRQADAAGMLPLQLAARQGSQRVIALAVAEHLDLDVPEVGGNTPLHSAVMAGQLQIADILLRGGAHVNAVDDSDLSPLAYVETAAMARLLLAHGAAVSALGPSGLTPLHRIARAPVEPDRQEFAAILGLLQQAGANVNAVSSSLGLTPLAYAAMYDYADRVEVLLAHGADPTIRSKEGRTPLACAVTSIRPDRQKFGAVLDLLQQAGVDVNAVDDQGMTALASAARNGDVGSVEVLLAHGADPTIRSKEGYTALDHAVQRHKGIVADLLRASWPTEGRGK